MKIERIDKTNDNYNLDILKKFKLPVIENVNQLLSIFLFSEDDEKKYFFSKNRKYYLYKKFTISKKTGGYRIIEVPTEKIFRVQKVINKVILSVVNTSTHVCGYVKGKSIVDNAKPHVGSKMLFKFDIQNFFGTISMKDVYMQFRFFGYGENVSRYLSYLCVNNDFVLPQGAPTSPVLSNLVCIKLDKRISAFCKKNDLTYTRYADDISISSKIILGKTKRNSIRNTICEIIITEGFEVNESKLNTYKQGSKMSITSIVVNDKLSVDKKRLREIDNAIRYIKKYGLDSHLEKIEFDINKNYFNYLYGLACYIKQIDKIKGEYYMSEISNLFGKEDDIYE